MYIRITVSICTYIHMETVIPMHVNIYTETYVYVFRQQKYKTMYI